MSRFLCLGTPTKPAAEPTHNITLNDDNSWVLVDGTAYPRSTLTAVRVKDVDGPPNPTCQIKIWIKAGDSDEVVYRTTLLSNEQTNQLYCRLVGTFSDLPPPLTMNR